MPLATERITYHLLIKARSLLVLNVALAINFIFSRSILFFTSQRISCERAFNFYCRLSACIPGTALLACFPHRAAPLTYYFGVRFSLAKSRSDTFSPVLLLPALFRRLFVEVEQSSPCVVLDSVLRSRRARPAAVSCAWLVREGPSCKET